MIDLTRHIREWMLWDKAYPRFWTEGNRLPTPIRKTVEDILNVIESEEASQDCEAPLPTWRSLYEMLGDIETKCDEIRRIQIAVDPHSHWYYESLKLGNLLASICVPLHGDTERLREWISQMKGTDYEGQPCDNWWKALEAACVVMNAQPLLLDYQVGSESPMEMEEHQSE